MDRLFDKLRIDRPVARLNWSVVDDPTLFQPTGRGNPNARGKLTADNAGERLWVRMERQTLRRLPKSKDILFTIRIHRAALEDAAGVPEVARLLHGALETLGAPMTGYKSLGALKPRIVRYLAERLG